LSADNFRESRPSAQVCDGKLEAEEDVLAAEQISGKSKTQLTGFLIIQCLFACYFSLAILLRIFLTEVIESKS